MLVDPFCISGKSVRLFYVRPSAYYRCELTYSFASLHPKNSSCIFGETGALSKKVLLLL